MLQGPLWECEPEKDLGFQPGGPGLHSNPQGQGSPLALDILPLSPPQPPRLTAALRDLASQEAGEVLGSYFQGGPPGAPRPHHSESACVSLSSAKTWSFALPYTLGCSPWRGGGQLGS